MNPLTVLPRRPHLPKAVVVTTLAVACLSVTLSSCSVHTESQVRATTPVDPRETVRAQLLSDATWQEQTAQSCLSQASAGSPTAVALQDMADHAQAHVSALGPASTTAPTPKPTAAPSATCDLGQLATAMSGTAARASSATATTNDAELTQLTGSIAVSRYLDAAELASAAGTSLTTPSASADQIAKAAPSAEHAALAEAEDYTGYGLEFGAARLSGDQRTRAAQDAAAHRSVAATLAGTVTPDPRRPDYEVPADATSAEQVSAYLAGLESDLVNRYIGMLPKAGATGRPTLVAAATTSASSARFWGQAPAALPGLATPDK